MSSSIIFMALQCSQCSNMQVKESRKKNSKSNKWRCVVCNQNQSIRKVFAQGPMAKDLRFFVQSFNMSRSHSHSSQPQPSSSPPPMLSHLQHSKRPRSDWTEFLDPADDHISQPGIDSGPEIVTELPVDDRLFKKPKLNKSEIRGGECYKPVFSKRNGKEASNQAKDGEEEKLRTLKRREAVSKWNHYMTREDDCDSDDAPLVISARRRSTEPANDWNDDMLESLMNEEKVEEEEIHPDFI